MSERIRPSIAVVVPLRVRGAPPAVQAVVDRLTSSALHLLTGAGADPWVIDTSADSRPPAQRVAAADGVLLLGGGDIDPTLYGVHEHPPQLYGVDPDGDAQAIGIVRASRAATTPLLGICRGSQVLNVALGGTVVPHLEDTGTHRDSTDGSFVDEKITLAPGSWAATVLGSTVATVRSGHHQAVAHTGSGLRAVAWGADGTIESIEHATWWAKGVQWHPEDPDGDAAAATALFTGFVSAVTDHG